MAPRAPRSRRLTVVTLRELGEREVVRRLLAVRPAASVDPESADRRVVVASGDDAAIVRPRPGRELVVTTDTMIADVHYRRDALAPAAQGARLAEMNLSDASAMAAEPRWAVVTIAASPDRDVASLLEFQRGLVEALARAGAVVVGGNLAAAAGPEWASLTLLGEVAPGRAWTRYAARPGDLVAVTGWPGRSGAGWALARARPGPAAAIEFEPLLDAWRAPRARVAFALALAATDAVTAAIDVSDGLALDLGRLCEASGVGARLEERAFPDDALLDAAAAALGVAALDLRLGPSDDYELLMAIDPAGRSEAVALAARLEVPFHVIGALTAAPAWIEWVGADGRAHALEPRGYDHFTAADDAI